MVGDRAKSFGPAPSRSTMVPLAVFLLVVGLDQGSKSLVLRSIDLDERIDIFGPLSLVRRYNTGVAFSLGDGSSVTAWLVTAVVTALLVWVVHTISRGAQPLFAVLLAAIAGGGVGNQLDRFFRNGGWNKGAVIDFVDVGFWPVFNVADMALSVGCAVLALWTLFGGGPDHPNPRASGPVASSLRSEDETEVGVEAATPRLGDGNASQNAVSATEALRPADAPLPIDNDSSTKGR